MNRSSRAVSPLRRAALGLAGVALTACFGAASCSDGAAPDIAAPPGEPAAGAYEEVIFVRVYYKDEADLDRMANGELDLLEQADRKAGWVGAMLDPAQYEDLLAEGYRVDVVKREVIVPRRPGRAAGIPGYPCYRTVEETHAAMSAIAAAHPTLAAVVDIGDSWEKATPGGNAGYDLLVLKITSSAVPGPKPRFFLMGGLHAREYTTAEMAMQFAETVVNGYGVDPDLTWLVDNHELHVMPQANPDGRKIAEQGYLQRKNTNNSHGGKCSSPPTQTNQYGTDLNRNSSFHYGGASTSTKVCNEFYKGPNALSEPETVAIQNYLASIFPDQRGPLDTDPAPSNATGVMITLHSYDNLILYPWGYGTTAAPNAAALATLARKMGFLNGYGACQASACEYAMSGTTDDWSYGALGVASYTIEMGTAFFEACANFTGSIAPANTPALLYAFKAARLPYQTPAGPDSVGVAVSPAVAVAAGTAVTLTATADDTRYDSHGWGTEPTQAIAAARYSVDLPSWAAGAVLVPMSAADGAFDTNHEGLTATIDTTGWASGRHLVMVESRDAAGNWGAPSAAFITIQ